MIPFDIDRDDLQNYLIAHFTLSSSMRYEQLYERCGKIISVVELIEVRDNIHC